MSSTTSYTLSSPELVEAIKQFYFLDVTFSNPYSPRFFRVKDNDNVFYLRFRNNSENICFTPETLAAWNQRQAQQNRPTLNPEQEPFYCTVEMEGFAARPVVSEQLVYKLASAMDFQEAVVHLINSYPSWDNTIEGVFRMYMLLQYTEAGGDLKLVNHDVEDAEFVHCYREGAKKTKFRFLSSEEIREVVQYACYMPLTFTTPFFEDEEFRAAVYEGKKVPNHGDVMKRLSSHVDLNAAIEHFITERDDCMGSNFV